MNKHIRILKLGIITENMDSNYIDIHNYMLNILKNIKLLNFNKNEKFIYNHIDFYGINKDKLYIGYNEHSSAVWVDDRISDDLFKYSNVYISNDEMGSIVRFYLVDYSGLAFVIESDRFFFDNIYNFFHISSITI